MNAVEGGLRERLVRAVRFTGNLAEVVSGVVADEVVSSLLACDEGFEGLTVVHHAVLASSTCNSLPLLFQLVSSRGICPAGIKDKQGRTVMATAVKFGAIDSVRALCKAVLNPSGADLIDHDVFGSNALSLAFPPGGGGGIGGFHFLVPPRRALVFALSAHPVLRRRGADLEPFLPPTSRTVYRAFLMSMQDKHVVSSVASVAWVLAVADGQDAKSDWDHKELVENLMMRIFRFAAGELARERAQREIC